VYFAAFGLALFCFCRLFLPLLPFAVLIFAKCPRRPCFALPSIAKCPFRPVLPLCNMALRAGLKCVYVCVALMQLNNALIDA
jgi:hypothetical protein